VTKFRHIPLPGRIIIIAVAFGVLATAAAACATSYNAIYHLVDQLGLYGTGITKLFPGLVDLPFIVGESAAILGGILRATTRSDEVTKGWPYTCMWVCGLCTIAFNVWHAALIGGLDDPLTVPRCVVASLPPVLMMVSFQVLISIVKWVMLHLGRPLDSGAALAPTTPGYGPGLPAAWAAYGHLGSPAASINGHPGNGGGELSGAAGDDTTKRALIDMYLSGLSPEHLQIATGSSIVEALAARGHTVSLREANRVLDQFRSTQQASKRKR